MVRDISIFKNDLSLGVPLALQLADDLINDVIVQSSQVVKISNHFLSEDHVLVVVVLENLLEELFDDVREVVLKGFDILLAEIGTSTVAL